jgi:nucleotide-binding universal stress UspA family protein
MDIQHQPLVVAVGPDGSAPAVHYAVREAVRRGRGLHLVHATGPVTADARTSRRRTEDATRLLALVAADAERLVAGRLPVTSAVIEGAPAPAVEAVAAHAPLLVMGRRSAAPHAHPQLKSATDGIAAHVRAPVAAVPDSWDGPPSEPLVVVGLDPAQPSTDALAQGFAAARQRRARLLLVAAWWRPVGADRHATLALIDEAKGSELLGDQLESDLAPYRAWYGDVSAEVVVSRAVAAEALVMVSDDADLLVLGRHEPWLPSGSCVGPVARTVLHEASCPVLLTAVGERRHHASRARGA